MNERQRPMTPEERAALVILRQRMPRRWKQAAENWTVMFAIMALVALVLGALVEWVLRKLFSIALGSETLTTLFFLAMCGCALYAAVSTANWMKRWKNIAPLLDQDIARGVLVEEHYVFKEAMRFQEPEHGGLLYCLHSIEGEVFCVFDHESQDLGIEGKDPLDSSFRPRSELLLVRAPASGHPVSKTFSGTVLDVGEAKGLNVRPELWPEQDEVCNTPWSELERRLVIA